MDRAKTIKATIIMVLMVVLIVWYYSYLSSKNDAAASNKALEEQTMAEMTAVGELLAKAEYKEYPSTPVQVVKYYNEITACFYNEQYTDQQLEKLADLASSLYDDELRANQNSDTYLDNIRADIKTFKSGNITIYNSEVSSATDVEYFEHNGYECARLYCLYTLKSGTNYQPSKEVFILRKDTEGHWKIFGFDLVEE